MQKHESTENWYALKGHCAIKVDDGNDPAVDQLNDPTTPTRVFGNWHVRYK